MTQQTTLDLPEPESVLPADAEDPDPEADPEPEPDLATAKKAKKAAARPQSAMKPNTKLPEGWSAPGWVVGLDLSLTGLGMVAVPCAWDLDFTRVLRRSLESDPKAPLVDRIRDLAIDVQRWVDWVGSRHNCAPSVFLEAPVTHAAYSLVPLAKLSGVVQHELRREMGIVCREAPQQDIRKLLLGKVPQRDRKAAIVQVVRAMVPDPEEWDDDQCDAFAVANYGLAQLESPFVTIARAA